MINERKIERASKPMRKPPTGFLFFCPGRSHYLNPLLMKTTNKQDYNHHLRLGNLLWVLWLPILLWCEPKVGADGHPLPVAAATANDATLLHSINPNEDRSTQLSASAFTPEQYSAANRKYDRGLQESGSYRTTEDRLEFSPSPREKRGLSYLSKYYSTAILNNFNLNGSGASSSSSENILNRSNQFFGVGGGNSGRSSSARISNEQRFPSSVRRKLSFYPPMVSHPTFMTPWSRIVGKPTNMRLRWGK